MYSAYANAGLLYTLTDNFLQFRMTYVTWNIIKYEDGRETGLILGQLPDSKHIYELATKHNVRAVVSCVEHFELKKFNVNLQKYNIEQIVLPQQDFSGIEVKMLYEGVRFLHQHLRVEGDVIRGSNNDITVVLRYKLGYRDREIARDHSVESNRLLHESITLSY